MPDRPQTTDPGWGKAWPCCKGTSPHVKWHEVGAYPAVWCINCPEPSAGLTKPQTTITVPVPPVGVLEHIEACINVAAGEHGPEQADEVARDWLNKVREARKAWEAARA